MPDDTSGKSPILIIEDDTIMVEMVRERLQHLGFPVVSTVSGAATLEWLASHTTSLMLLDYTLPDMNGMDIIDRLADRPGGVPPFLVITATGNEQVAVDLMKRGARDYLLKGENFLDLLPTAVYRVLREVETERQLRNAQAERRRVERDQTLLAKAIENSADITVITDANGLIEYVNPAFERITGYGREEVLGKNLRLLKSGRHDAAFYREFWSTISSGNVWSGVFINLKKDGTEYEEKAIVSPILDETGKIVNYVADKRDVTQERLLESQLRQAQKIETIGQLAGGIAHDFNNILQTILGYISVVISEIPPRDPHRQDLIEAHEAAKKAATLTRQLLAFSRRQLLDLRHHDLNETIANMLKMLHRLIGEHIELFYHPTPNLPGTRFDAGQIEQVLVNLCLNARDAMPKGGRVDITTGTIEVSPNDKLIFPDLAPGRYLSLSVSDSGCGMSNDVQQHIFEPFFTTKDVGKGSGLGLAMVYGIIKQHDGMIHVYSEIDRGTTIRIYLPVQPEEGTDDNLRETTSAHLPGGSETILFAEDDEGIRKIVSRVLVNAGYQVLVAADGVEALQLFQAHQDKIHLALLDVVMPRLGGRDVFHQIRASQPALPVLFSSGYSPDAIHTHFILDKGMELIQKPFNMHELLKHIRKLLDTAPPTGMIESQASTDSPE